jgi:hypothetical protein
MKRDVGRKSRARFLLLLLPFASKAFGLDAGADSIAQALSHGDLQTAYRVILSEKDGSKIAPAFHQESKLSSSDPVLKARMDEVARAFDNRLRNEMSPLTFGAYRQFAADTTLREGDRMRLILPMIECAYRLRSIQRDTLKIFLKGMLASGISTKMKAFLLIQATRFSSIGLDGKALLPFFRSPDTTIRKAAAKGLIHVIAQNRDRRNFAPNRAIFDSTKGNSSHIPDRYELLVFASLGEDYSRDYLLSRCGTDAAKLVAVIRHDPYLRHAGLAYAALAFSNDTPQGAATREALRYGLQDPEWVAGQIASGSFSDSAKADELRKVMAIQTTASR